MVGICLCDETDLIDDPEGDPGLDDGLEGRQADLAPSRRL